MAYAMDSAHHAAKDAKLWKNVAPSQSRKPNLFVVENMPRYVKDSEGKVLNPCVKSLEIPRWIMSFFPASSFRNCERLLVFSSGEDYGWIALLALELGFDLIATCPDETTFFHLKTRIAEAIPGARKRYEQTLKAQQDEKAQKEEEANKELIFKKEVQLEVEVLINIGMPPEEALTTAEKMVRERKAQEQVEDPISDVPITLWCLKCRATERQLCTCDAPSRVRHQDTFHLVLLELEDEDFEEDELVSELEEEEDELEDEEDSFVTVASAF